MEEAGVDYTALERVRDSWVDLQISWTNSQVHLLPAVLSVHPKPPVVGSASVRSALSWQKHFVSRWVDGGCLA